MKVLLLVTIITWSFSMDLGGNYRPPYVQIVSTPEDAAIKIYHETKAAEREIEPDQKEYHLYEISFKGQPTIKEIPIPKVSFEFKDSL